MVQLSVAAKAVTAAERAMIRARVSARTFFIMYFLPIKVFLNNIVLRITYNIIFLRPCQQKINN